MKKLSLLVGLVVFLAPTFASAESKLISIDCSCQKAEYQRVPNGNFVELSCDTGHNDMELKRLSGVFIKDPPDSYLPHSR